MRDLVGETLAGRYTLVARIAGGGMGEVYRGQDLLLDRSVAVKVMSPSLAREGELIARFRAEARAAARLAHPNIVTVHDWGSEDEQTYFMVMEYVSGTDLRDLLVAQGSLEPAQVAGVIASVCDALAAAHRAGVVHRDVKPENVLIARDGTAKVTDFGIAAVTGTDITMPGGAIPGTLRYLAPEQARGEEASPASDIWAAGAVLAELLTGRPPQQGAGADLLQRRANDPPMAPSEYAENIPSDLDTIVLKACALDPRDRYRDATEMAADLRRVTARSIPEAPAIESLLGEVTGEIVLPDMEPTTYVRRNGGRGRRSKKAMWMRLGIVGVVLALLVFGAVGLVNALLAPKDVPVPSLGGLALVEAIDKAEDLGLDVTVVGRRKDPDVQRGHIVSQTPDDGMLKEGKSIDVIVSTGPPKYAVPDVIGMKVVKAKRVLRDKHMAVGAVTQEYSMEPVGTVIKQSPRDGRLLEDTKIELVVSQGPPLLGVPDVAGLKLANARWAIKAAGFTVELATDFSDEVAEGRVISTTPVANTSAPQGSEIVLIVSKGPEFETMRMPDVRSMSVNAARAKLEGMGLRVRVNQSCPGDRVVDTDPLPGQLVRENDLVIVFVC